MLPQETSHLLSNNNQKKKKVWNTRKKHSQDSALSMIAKDPNVTEMGSKVNQSVIVYLTAHENQADIHRDRLVRP